MTDIERIVWGGLAGVAVYVIGQLLSKFLIEPLHELRKAVGAVRFHLAFHAPAIHTPIGRSKDSSDSARKALLESSCELIAKLHAVPLYAATRHLSLCALPKRESIETAAIKLRGLSTYVHEDGETAALNIESVNKRVAQIERLLCIKPLE